MVYVDPLKLQAHELSPMDVVRATDASNLILPAGDVRIGPMDYNIYTNAQVANAQALNDLPLKTEGQRSVFVSDIGQAVDGSALQYNIVRVNGQKSVYVAVQKQGGNTNTIEVVNGIKKAIQSLRDIPAQLKTAQTFATAERDLWFPTISAVGAAGLIPFHANVTTTGLNDQYAAAGFNVNIPIFNGHLFGALRNEAQARALAQQQNLRDLQDRIVRDVNKAWLDANSGYQRLSVVQQLVNQATLALNLAQARYQLGLSSIIELTQAQLNLTEAQIEQVNATYDYQTQLSALNYQIGNLR
jgi:hypothetical protein